VEKQIKLNDCDWFVPFSEEWEWDKIISILKSWGYVWEEQTYGIFEGVEPHWIKWKVESKFIGVSVDLGIISWWHSLRPDPKKIRPLKTLMLQEDRDKKLNQLI
jgi:hypothetical protein